MTNPWRPWLLALCALGLVFAVTSTFRVNLSGTFGLSATATSAPFVDRLTVAPGSAAEEAGIRSGDFLDWRSLPPWIRFRLWTGAYVGEPVALPIVRDGSVRSITVVARHSIGYDWVAGLFLVGSFWILLLCTVLVWRRSDAAEVRFLVLYLLVEFVIREGFYVMTSAWPAFDFLSRQVGLAMLDPSVLFLAFYAACFGKPISKTRRALIVVAVVCAAYAAVAAVARAQSIWNGSVDPLAAGMLGYRTELGFRIAVGGEVAAILLSLAMAYGTARPAEKTRISWALAAVVPPLLWVAVVVLAGPLIPSAPYTIVTGLFWFASPAILSYSLLSRRLFDIGFVVNRAAVFTGVSVVLLGTFVVIEWLLADWLRTASDATNVLVSGAVALALGLSIRFVHGRVDRVVDYVFFRKRHEDEEAIRTFAREAPYVTDSEILLKRTSETLTRHTDAASVDLVLDYDENDPAILRLRAKPQVLDLHGIETQLRGEIAFPMTARGSLVGVIALGPRGSAESYAPDETSAIQQLADSVAAAVDTLAMRNGHVDVLERLVASMDALRAEIERRLPSEPR